MVQCEPCPSVNFDTSAFEPRHRHDAWQSYFEGLSDIRSLVPTNDAIRFRTQSRRIGKVILSRFTYRSRVLAVGGTRRENSAEDLVLFCINLAGNSRGILDETPVDFEPGAVHVLDRSRPIRLVCEKRDTLILAVPNASAAIGYDPSRQPGYSTHHFDTPLGRILRANIEAMFETLPTAGADEGFALTDGLCGLLKAIVTRDLRDETVRYHFERGRAGALMRYIDQNLRNPSIVL